MTGLGFLKKLFARRPSGQDVNPRWQVDRPLGFRESLGLSRWSMTALVTSLGLIGFLFCALLAIAPVLATLFFIAVSLLAGLWALFLWSAPGMPWWVKLLTILVTGLAILNVGVAGMIFGPSSLPIPVTDAVLALVMPAALYHVAVGSSRFRIPLGMILLALWVFISYVLHLSDSYRMYKLDALRDAIRMGEALVIIPAFVATKLALQRPDKGRPVFTRLLVGLGFGVAIYGLLSPARDVLSMHSPAFSGGKTYSPLLGSYQSWPMVGLVAVFGVLMYRWAVPGPRPFRVNFFHALIIGGGLLTFGVLQSRGSYVFMVLAITASLIIGGQARLIRVFLAFGVVGATILLGIEFSGVELKGRVGKIGLTPMIEHAISVTGKAKHDSEFAGAAGGIDQRKAWRRYSLNLWSRGWDTRLVGIGYGRALSDLKQIGKDGKELTVPDPHNSYVTTLTRYGLVGLTVFLCMQSWAVYMGVVGYRRFRHKNRRVAAFYFTLLIFMLYTLVDAWGEPHFELTHYIVVTYALIGAAWALWQHMHGSDVPVRRPRTVAMRTAAAW